MSIHRAPLPVHDGTTGGPVGRTEPKVRAATYAAFITPILLVLARQHVPGLAEVLAQLPLEAQAGIGTALTGAVTWVAGYFAQAVDRIDLFPRDADDERDDVGELADAVFEEVYERLAEAGLLPDGPDVQDGLPPVPITPEHTVIR